MNYYEPEKKTKVFKKKKKGFHFLSGLGQWMGRIHPWALVDTKFWCSVSENTTTSCPSL